ncbi:hypothetical protein llap_2561 [Limosa lapponica baueri]|uniref:Uncharacterized protein n=1 Tax=Limosa lapponica baueri TaxID=1758121 RepID=A0A2I0UM46_LIMLA|nr:hypothetical protein llap_2561 [Limosa lapponica baueri]
MTITTGEETGPEALFQQPNDGKLKTGKKPIKPYLRLPGLRQNIKSEKAIMEFTDKSLKFSDVILSGLLMYILKPQST